MPTKTLRPLKPGDPCTVRLHTGEIVEALYRCRSLIPYNHYVLVKGVLHVVVRGAISVDDECRFTTKPPAART